MINIQSTLQFCSAVSLVVAPTSTAATFIESKVKNPIISTISKIVQLIPSAFLSGFFVFWGIVEYDFKHHLENNFEGIDGFKIANIVGIAILALPILITTLKKVAIYKSWNNLAKALNVFEKHYMTIAKVVNIAIITLGLIGASLTLTTAPSIPVILMTTAYLAIGSSLLILNVYKTIQQLRSYMRWT
jgi:hypothetical protein